MIVTRAPQVMLKRMSSISYDFRVNLHCSEGMVGGRLYLQRLYHSPLISVYYLYLYIVEFVLVLNIHEIFANGC